MVRLSALAPLLALLLAACGSGAGRPDRPTRSPHGGPLALAAEPSRATRQCFADLSSANVRFSPLPDRDFGGGCVLTGTVQLIDFGVPTTNLTAMACPLSRTFVAWVRHGVVPAAQEILGSPVVKVESMGTYACRNRVGTASTRLSEHALGNAVDVSAFVLRDGRRITIKDDWRSGDAATRAFLQVVRRSACRRFTTVLSPDYNAAHHDHLHFDMGGRSFCR